MTKSSKDDRCLRGKAPGAMGRGKKISDDPGGSGGPSSSSCSSRDGPEPEDPIWERVDPEVGRNVEVLRGLVAASGRCEAEIEALLGWEPSRLRQRLERPQELAYDEIVAILGAIGVDVMDFFVLLASGETEH